MTLIKRDRAINIENQEPSVGAILQSGNNYNSISNAIDDEIKQNSDDAEPEKVFPIGHLKHSYEGKFRITNHAWDDRLKDSSSDMFKELASDLEEGIQEILVPESSLLNNDAEFHVTVLDFQ